MKTRNFSLIALLAAAIVNFNSCKEENATEILSKETVVDHNCALADKVFNDIGNYSTAALSIGKGKLKSGYTVMNPDAGCLQISFDLSSVPNKLILDFGSVNCKCEDGINRRGKIIISCEEGFNDSLSTLYTTLENFFVNDNQISGSRAMTYKGHNQSGHSNWDVEVNGSIVLASGEGTINYQSSHNSEMIEGEFTPGYTDNVFSITGSAIGTAVTGQAFSSLITTPLISKMNCAYFTSGIIEISPAGEAVRTINYGGGECDRIATITADGSSFDIILP